MDTSTLDTRDMLQAALSYGQPADLAKLGNKRFNGFLELHVNGAYSPEARQQRFNALFLLAHKAFILNDRENYVLNNLKSGKTG